MDIVSEIQEELVKLGDQLASTYESVPQVHQPPPAPPPPYGVDPMRHYQEYWAKRAEESPFATLGFMETSEEAKKDKDRWTKEGDKIITIMRRIEELLENPIISKSEEEQLDEIAKLSKENELAEQELRDAASEAVQFISELRALHRHIATGALEF
mmetsp:Transcript_7191/g.9368  ORF Transcript_7191/g.9368 Transcript_7191/m.9368 type:complete len:156 (-) Transcript_7191:499-966(-)|eukprot:CAMPEP_0184012810 /NCGR_PEP_ID=MMETSP0954-20121128/4648_1 /TAXON_ID=627963 /ORGANISM="Aplanochytrium sp, Strain PBS07" /LENGTH=155 /DNA_ID=CAMNT_0026292897 /DNA_START=157 /DNA_END=624 /DNA_ORIENTATION=+